MLPVSRSSSTDSLIFALCTASSQKLPAKVYNLELSSLIFKSVDVKDPRDDKASQFVNCVVMSDDMILCALDYSYSIFSKDLKELANIFRTSIHPKCRMIFCLSESFSKCDLVLVFDANPDECKNKYEVGIRPDRNSLVSKAEIDPKSG